MCPLRGLRPCRFVFVGYALPPVAWGTARLLGYSKKGVSGAWFQALPAALDVLALAGSLHCLPDCYLFSLGACAWERCAYCLFMLLVFLPWLLGFGSDAWPGRTADFSTVFRGFGGRGGVGLHLCGMQALQCTHDTSLVYITWPGCGLHGSPACLPV